MDMIESAKGYDPSKLLTWMLGIVGTIIAAGVIASFALLLGMDKRLTAIETIVGESKEERRSQIIELRETDRDLMHRVSGIERVVYNGRRGRRDDE